MRKRKPKRTVATFKRDVFRMCHWLKRMFFLHSSDMEIVWRHAEHLEHKDGGAVAAQVCIPGGYLYFQVIVYKALLDRYLDGHEIASILVHEFCHHITQPIFSYAHDHLPECMRQNFRDLMERQTDLMVRVVLPDYEPYNLTNIRKLETP